MKKIFSKTTFIILLIIISILTFRHFKEYNFNKLEKITYSEFINEIKNKNVKNVLIENYNVLAIKKNNKGIITTSTPWNKNLIQILLNNSVKFSIKIQNHQSVLFKIFISWFPTFLIIISWLLLVKQIKNNKKNNFSFGNFKPQKVDYKNNKINFSHIAGCDEAKQELKELVEFLKNPKKFQKLGGRIPSGVLMVGPPGTGKTLLAKAVAGEAKVPFFATSGSNFVEMFVGIGASRIRSIFEDAKKNSPCIIFIDEIDAVGRHRSSGINHSNDEREQTLNQLLVEMDGFQTNSKVIVIAATNRIDILDKALLRPGRFDRQVLINLPDIKGREQILKVHIVNILISQDVKINILARGTSGFSGADLKNLINEATLNAACLNKNLVEMKDFEYAKDKILMGPERKSAIIREEDRINIAYHESGHTVVAKLLPLADPVHKVTIIPRGYALGLTYQLPEYDKINLYKDKLLEEISILFAGRIAEEIFIKRISTGAYNDFERATKIARSMVTCYGMSETLGFMVYENINKDFSIYNNQEKFISEKTQYQIDMEIKKILSTQYKISKNIIKRNKNKVEIMAKKLLEFETIDSDQINDIMNDNSKVICNKLL